MKEKLINYFKNEKIYATDFFLDEHSEINLQELSYNIEDKDSFILKVISHPKVGYIEEKLLKKETFRFLQHSTVNLKQILKMRFQLNPLLNF